MLQYVYILLLLINVSDISRFFFFYVLNDLLSQHICTFQFAAIEKFGFTVKSNKIYVECRM